MKTYRSTDIGNRAICSPQERRGALQAPGEQISVRRVTERATELATEMGARQPGRAGHVVHTQRLEIAAVGGVLGAEQVTGRWDEGHTRSIAAERRPGTFPEERCGFHRAGPLAASINALARLLGLYVR